MEYLAEQTKKEIEKHRVSDNAREREREREREGGVVGELAAGLCIEVVAGNCNDSNNHYHFALSFTTSLHQPRRLRL
jgi:hypothetical protein